jgi:hypothetical protein
MKKPSFIFRRPVYTWVPVLTLILSLTLASAMARAGNGELTGADMEDWLMATSGSPVERCEIQYLKSLGWRVVLSDSGKIEIRGGNPCDDDSIEASQAQGELEIAIPADATTAELQSLLAKLNYRGNGTRHDYLVSGVASRCAYKHKVAAATSSAIKKLQANGEYDFSLNKPLLPHGFVDLGFLGGVRKGWKALGPGLRHKVSGLAYYPRSSNSEAMETFFTEKVRTECAAGLQVAEYALLHDLYGKENFDQAFSNDEIVIGTWNQVGSSKSVIHGRNTGRVVGDTLAIRSSRLGGKALIGRTGYLGNLFGEEFLDNKPNRGENLLIAEISHAASESIVRAGGLEKFNGEMYRIWEIRRDVNPLGERLRANDKLPVKQRMPAEERAALYKKWKAGQDEIARIYSDPFYTQVMTYTHPFKRYYTIKDHLDHVGEVNPRTPYSLKLYGDVINEGLYDRYAKYQIGQCLKANPTAPEPVIRTDRVAALDVKQTPMRLPSVKAPVSPATLSPLEIPEVPAYEAEAISAEDLEELRSYHQQQADEAARAAEAQLEASTPAEPSLLDQTIEQAAEQLK